MSFESVLDTLEIRNANKISFVGTSSSFIDTTTGRIQTKGIQHNSNVITDVSGPHGRVAPTLKKYPEIVFEDGKFDSNDSTNTYIQAGYTVSSSGKFNNDFTVWTMFDETEDSEASSGNWIDSPNTTYAKESADAYGGLVGNVLSTVHNTNTLKLASNTPVGAWFTIELPNSIKLHNIQMRPRSADVDIANQSFPKEFGIWGYDGNVWTLIKSVTGHQANYQTLNKPNYTITNVNATTLYKKYGFVITRTNAVGGSNNDDRNFVAIGALKLYGYEEYTPAGDHSVDTSFKSRFNNPQLTGVQVLVDGNAGQLGANQISGGPDPSGNNFTYDATNKYWTLNGTLTSNLSVEANTFLEGDQPHAVSVWFNSSNLEANVSNTCVFSISDQEHLNSQNLDLQSNTWHNLTYAYQGEGGSRVTYLDGRKVEEAQVEDTFGDYPPFAMTGYSQGGYVVSASSEHIASSDQRLAWKAFDGNSANEGSPPNVWQTNLNTYNTSGDFGIASGNTTKGTFTADGVTYIGEWIKLEIPHKFILNSLKWESSLDDRRPKKGAILGSNDDVNWYTIRAFNNDLTWTTNSTADYAHITSNSNSAYKYVIAVIEQIQGNDGNLWGNGISLYGHRENDLVRLPDPTNVLKYPHIIVNEPAKRGYVVSQSSELVPPNSTGSYQAYNIFDGELVFDGGTTNTPPNGTAWITRDSKYDGSGNPTGTAATTDVTGQSPVATPGEYFQLELPHKVKLSSIRVMGSTESVAVLAGRSPVDAVLAGSNDGTAWTTVLSYTGASWATLSEFKSFPANVDSTNAYKYFRFIITKNGGQGLGSLQAFEFYGTEEDISIPIQIGGGNIDKVANFRVYDKFIGEDQVLEIWDAQKEEFGRAKPQMILQQGKLGIGTDAPQGSLSVADEPDTTTYGLQEFPPRGMTGEETYIEGHGVFTASVSSVYSTSNLEGWRAFDKNTTSTLLGRWTAAIADASTIGSLSGKWVKLELPYRVNFSKVGIFPSAYSGGSAQCPTGFSIIVSNDDETWTTIKTLSSYTWKEFDYNYITFENDGYFKYIAIVATTDGSNGATSFQEILYLGYREQVTKQSVLHDGQLTLTKNLTVPRIGPALVEYPTPRQDKIHLQYDTSLSIHADNHIMDTSGRSKDLSRSGNGYYNSGTESLHFDGNDTYYNSGIGDWSDNQHHTHSFWVKTTSNTGNPVVLWNTVSNSHDYSGVSINAGSHFSFWHFGNDHNYNYNVQKNVWYHVAAVYNGNSKTQKMYINGEEIPVTTPGTFSSLSMGTNPKISLGGDYGRSNYYFAGEMSKYRLHSIDLTPEEVFTLYKQGRTTPVHHLQLVDSTMTIGSHNRHRDAQLDVAGHIRAGASEIHSFTGQHRCFPDEPVEKGLIVSAKKNQFVKLNGFAVGEKAITIDESLPIVSLSNVVQDKACFGVVSSLETNALKRSQIVNGIISETNKEKGDNRAIVNSVGEGAIWVVDTNGPLESGDYITTSNVAGYGQKQDDDVLHNFTVAKITMDCDFTGSNVAVQTIKREQTGTRIITEDAWNRLVEYDRYSNVEDEITTYYQVQRGGNVLDENGQLQFEDKTGATEEPYERRFLTTDGSQTDSANAVHIAAFVGCTYHCG